MSRSLSGILIAASAMVDTTALALWREERLMTTGEWSETGWLDLPEGERQRWRRLAYAAVLAIVDPDMLAKIG